MNPSPPRGPAWVQCPMCEDWWCIIHMDHVWECDCSAIGEGEWETIDPREDDAVEYTDELARIAGEIRREATLDLQGEE